MILNYLHDEDSGQKKQNKNDKTIFSINAKCDLSDISFIVNVST